MPLDIPSRKSTVATDLGLVKFDSILSLSVVNRVIEIKRISAAIRELREITVSVGGVSISTKRF